MIKTINYLKKQLKEVHGETIMIGFQEKKIDNLSNSKVISLAWFGDIIDDFEEVELPNKIIVVRDKVKAIDY